jgi:hypothetical protein
MSFKENLKAKINLDRLLQKLVSTMREPPGKRWLDKVLTRELLDMTDLEHKKVGISTSTYALWRERSWRCWYTTVADVALRKSPHWQQMFSIRNIKKIMNDKDVMISKGKITFLDLTYVYQG